MQTLASLGVSFDCASQAELGQILALGVSPQRRIIYAHPCKPASHLRFAATQGVDLMTFDNELELLKVKELFPSARLVLRIRADDPLAEKDGMLMAAKFGAALSEALHLLGVAQSLGLTVVGVSFHVGSGCLNAAAYTEAIAAARQVFDQASMELKMTLTLLDLGGGFPGQSRVAITLRKVRVCECHSPSSLYEEMLKDNSFAEV